mgnify:CR=1 FL=1
MPFCRIILANDMDCISLSPLLCPVMLWGTAEERVNFFLYGLAFL